MCLDFDGHHFGGSSFDLYIIFLFCYKMWAIPTGISSALEKKNHVKSPSSVSRLGTRFGSANRVGPGIEV